MARSTGRPSAAFDAIMQGLEEAIAYQRGELVEGTRVTHVERLPNGTIHREVQGDSDATP